MEIKTDLMNKNCGDFVTFGTYLQNTDTEKKEPIEWQILEKKEDKVLLISRYALSRQSFNQTPDYVTWETCDLRKWLNSEFFENAFSDDEKALIVSMTVTADRNPKYRTRPGNDTIDKVFLLSIVEAFNYFNSDNERQCQPTENAKQEDADSFTPSIFNDSNGCQWWVRSPGFSRSDAANVDSGGHINYNGLLVTNTRSYVRPALWIDLK